MRVCVRGGGGGVRARVFVLIDPRSQRLCPLICQAEEKTDGGKGRGRGVGFWPEVLQNESIWGLGFLSVPSRSFFIM